MLQTSKLNNDETLNLNIFPEIIKISIIPLTNNHNFIFCLLIDDLIYIYLFFNSY
jgi:hypothetical protein